MSLKNRGQNRIAGTTTQFFLFYFSALANSHDDQKCIYFEIFQITRTTPPPPPPKNERTKIKKKKKTKFFIFFYLDLYPPPPPAPTKIMNMQFAPAIAYFTMYILYYVLITYVYKKRSKPMICPFHNSLPENSYEKG